MILVCPVNVRVKKKVLSAEPESPRQLVLGFGSGHRQGREGRE